MRARFELSLAGLALALALAGVAGTGPLGALPAYAGAEALDAARIGRLTDTMQLAPLLAVIREEGLAYGDGLDRSLLGGKGGVPWRAVVARAYDTRAARSLIEAKVLDAAQADPQMLAALESFYAGPVGQKIAGLEVAARRAMLDPASKDAAMVAWDDMSRAGAHRAAQLQAMVEAEGLIEQNVVGTMNANLALYRGLKEGGGLKSPVSDSEAQSQIASQQAQVSAAAAAWLYPYLMLAYQPLSDQELDQYVRFLASPEGARANQAMFMAFDALYTGISHDLGLAAAQRIAGEEI